MGSHQHQNLVHRSPYVSQAPSQYLFSSAPQYAQSQAVSHYPLCPPVPAPRSFPQSSPFAFQQQRTTLPQPPQMTYQSYSSGYHPYTTYTPPSELLPSYQHLPLAHMHDPYRPSIFGCAALPASVLQNILSHLGYLDVIRLSWVNRHLYSSVNPNQVPEEEKIALMLRAEQEYKRYSLRTAAPSTPEGDHVGRDSGHLACYHCFKMKPPSEFELFRYNVVEETEETKTEGSTRSHTPAPPSNTTPRPCYDPSNPHYDPSITRSRIAPPLKQGGKSKGGTSTQTLSDSPRIKETWGTRRFCIPCGVKKGYYTPGAYIELRSEKPGGKERRGKKGEKEGKEAKWICSCYKIHKKPETLQCTSCGAWTPLSQNRGIPADNTSTYSSSPFATSSYIPTTNC